MLREISPHFEHGSVNSSTMVLQTLYGGEGTFIPRWILMAPYKLITRANAAIPIWSIKIEAAETTEAAVSGSLQCAQL